MSNVLIPQAMPVVVCGTRNQPAPADHGPSRIFTACFKDFNGPIWIYRLSMRRDLRSDCNILIAADLTLLLEVTAANFGASMIRSFPDFFAGPVTTPPSFPTCTQHN